MTDLTMTIAPKSDQLNADDLIGGPRTIKVTGVRLKGEAEQPVAIHFDGDDGKPYLPCKSMRRVLVQVWGGDGKLYEGRRMTLYRDEKVMFGGAAVGGIRISHMSNIDKDVTLALTASRASRKPYTVRPLKEVAEKPSPKPTPKKAAEPTPEFDPEAFTNEVDSRLENSESHHDLKAWWESPETMENRKALYEYDAKLANSTKERVNRRVGELAVGVEA